jgi:hypothetical protein
MSRRSFIVAALALLGCGCGLLNASEPVTLNLAGKSARFDVVKISKAGIVLKADGKEQTVPMEVLTPDEVRECYKQIDTKDAPMRLAMGSYLFKRKIFDKAAEELKEAVKLDAKLAAQADPMLKQIEEKKPSAVAVAPDKTKAESKPEDKPAQPDKKDRKNVSIPSNMSEKDIEEFLKRREKEDVPPRTDAEMADFLKKREEELNKAIGGKWRMIETKHFYSFSNLPEPKHKMISNDWLEMPRLADGRIGIYPLLCEVLLHKDGDKLWNNKCPIYFFDKYSEFQTFAAQIDRSPGAGNSGGYFSSQGREVHICIPFMTQRLGEKGADRQAKSTLYHEGTHAFLQLSGEDAHLSRWLHEGLAQFIEFWFDSKNNPERNDRAEYLVRQIFEGEIPTWTSMKERPMGGTDLDGYAWAWLKFEYLYRNFDNQRVPKMIRMIKTGVKEDEAVEKIFGKTVEQLEGDFRTRWIKTRKNWDKPN